MSLECTLFDQCSFLASGLCALITALSCFLYKILMSQILDIVLLFRIKEVPDIEPSETMLQEISDSVRTISGDVHYLLLLLFTFLGLSILLAAQGHHLSFTNPCILFVSPRNRLLSKLLSLHNFIHLVENEHFPLRSILYF